jgi:hypothetical protein
MGRYKSYLFALVTVVVGVLLTSCLYLVHSRLYDLSEVGYNLESYTIKYFAFVDPIENVSSVPDYYEMHVPPGFGGYFYTSDGSLTTFYTVLRESLYKDSMYTMDLYLLHGSRYTTRIPYVVYEGWGEQGKQLFSTFAYYDKFKVDNTTVEPVFFAVYTYLLAHDVNGVGSKYDPVVSFSRVEYKPNSTTASSNGYDLNLKVELQLANASYQLVYDNYTDLILRPILTPYTETPTSVVQNVPEAVFAVFNIKDKNRLWSILAAKSRTFLWSTVPRVYEYSYVIPIGYLYTQDRSKVYLLFLAIVGNYPSYVMLDYAVFSTTDYSFISGGAISSVNVGYDIYDPESYVIFMQPKLTFVKGTSHDLETKTPFRVAIYSPIKKRLVVLRLSLGVDASAPDSYTFTPEEFIVDNNIDLSSIVYNSSIRARITWLDVVSPRAQMYGYLAFRNTMYDSDVNYDPYSVKVYRYSGGQWSEQTLTSVIPKIGYSKPKTSSYPQEPAVAINGYYIPYLLDMQLKSYDGMSAEGFTVHRLQVVPYKDYNITPSKFKININYTCSVTPISITYERKDPTYPENLTNVLVPIKITDPSVLNAIATSDGRDVRFFLTNSYGPYYWNYTGLTYAIKSLSPSEAEFYVLIPSISANSTVTIYMYSGFKYAHPVASDYHYLMQKYPLLLPTQ